MFIYHIVIDIILSLYHYRHHRYYHHCIVIDNGIAIDIVITTIIIVIIINVINMIIIIIDEPFGPRENLCVQLYSGSCRTSIRNVISSLYKGICLPEKAHVPSSWQPIVM